MYFVEMRCFSLKVAEGIEYTAFSQLDYSELPWGDCAFSGHNAFGGSWANYKTVAMDTARVWTK